MGNPTLLNCRSDLVIKIPVRLGEWVDVHFTENVQSVQRIINFFDKAIDKKTMSVDPPLLKLPNTLQHRFYLGACIASEPDMSNPFHP